MIHHGDCIEVMATFDVESVDAIVTDPPYGLGFMGKDWDSPGGVGNYPMRRTTAANTVNTGASRQGGRQRSTIDFARRQARDMREYQAWCELWAGEALRVAKPGAHLLAFGGSRTYHRLACAIEDAGWEVRDCLVWAYASGFPKSANPGRQHDLAQCRKAGTHNDDSEHVCLMVAPVEWYGLGTALKPAWEPIILARKSVRGTVAANVQEYGTGALNIDGCRIEAPEGSVVSMAHSETGAARGMGGGLKGGNRSTPQTLGRWPANVVLTDPVFDGGWEGVVGGGEAPGGISYRENGSIGGMFGQIGQFPVGTPNAGYGDSGTYSRFFLVPKADRADREPVIAGGAQRVVSVWGGDEDDLTPGKKSTIARQNVHPTVKPTDLMRHLIRLVTPSGGTVLDPFLGSGSTAIAAELEGFEWIGIEKEAEYVAIAEARLNGTQRGLGLAEVVV